MKITVADMRSIKHKEACTMPHYDLEHVGLERIRADFWGGLNYIWCMGSCDWPDNLRDAKAVYEAAHGKAPWWRTRRWYLRWWREDRERKRKLGHVTS